MSDIHPLDREDDDPISGSSSSVSPRTASPLRPFVIGVVIVGSLVMLTSIWMNNASFNSTNYRVAFAVNRVLMVLLLASFLGLLLYFQRKNLVKIFERLQGPTTPPHHSQATAMDSTQSMMGSKVVSTAHPQPVFHQGPSTVSTAKVSLFPMFVLIGANFLLLLVIWCISMLISGLPMPWLMMLFSTSLTLLPGLLICMIIWNRGMVRAYAVGLLTTHLTSAIGFLAMLGPMGMQYGNNYYGSGEGYDFAWTLAGHWTVVVFGGLVPACYIAILTYYHSRQQKTP